jgi:O-antigen/teichoic acid export membrane protein
VAAILGALTALACAYAGWGVWTLVAAPIVLWWTRAIGLTIAAKSLVWPSFRFKGAGKLFGYGGAMVVVQFCWFLQSQSDVFIGGRMLTAHDLGIYTTALFLTQILAMKFVPPLNDVAFAAYSRIQADRDVVSSAFLKGVRLIMLVALPFYFGLAATAEPFVLTFLGEKWSETVPLVPILSGAMMFMTLQILFAPATNALGSPRAAVRVGFAGAVLLPAAFYVGIHWGSTGLAWGWLGGMASLAAATVLISLKLIGVRKRELAGAIAPGLAASMAMAVAVLGLDMLLPPMAAQARLLALVGAGAATYGALLFLFAPRLIEEVGALLRRPKEALGAPAQAV